MSKHHAEIEGIEWKNMDVRGMEEIPPQSIDVAFDKGTLDAMIYGSGWDPPDEVRENTGRYMREVRSSNYLSIGAMLSREVKLTRLNSRSVISSSQTESHLHLCHISATALCQAPSERRRHGLGHDGRYTGWS
jgi:hypothetical protein